MSKAMTKSDKKTAFDLENWALHTEKERFGGVLYRRERRELKALGIDVEAEFGGLITDEAKKREAIGLSRQNPPL